MNETTETTQIIQEERVKLPRYSDCFVCGNQNPIGLDITFYYANGRIETHFTPQKKHAGYKNIVHGGILATLLDETMGWSSILSRRVMGVAAELHVRYKIPAQVGERLLIYGELVADKKRMMLTRGAIERDDGTLVCTGEGKFVPLPAKDQSDVIAYAQWENALEDAFHRIQTCLKKREQQVCQNQEGSN